MIRDYLRLVRWPNLLFLGIVIWAMEYWVAVPVLHRLHWDMGMPWWLVSLLIVASVTLAAGGYVVNDYFDIKIDRINRPDRLIVSRSVSKEKAMWLYRILTAVGIVTGEVAAWICRSWMVAAIFPVVGGLLWFYSASYKRQLIIGNVVVGALAALPSILIWAVNIGLLRRRYGDILDYATVDSQLGIWLLGFAGFAFLGTWIREIQKDLEDQDGDRELECHSLPIVWGDNVTRIIVTVMLLGMMALCGWLVWGVLPLPHGWKDASVRFLLFGLWTPMLCDLVLMWSAKIPSDYRSTQQVMKLVLFLGTMFSFVIFRCL